MSEVPINGREGVVAYALVDDEDFERVRQHSWHLAKGYAYSKKAGFMHRLVLGVEKGVEVDHINHQPLDNRKENLRPSNRFQNNQNVRPYSRSGYKGVDKRRHTWRARIYHAGKQKVLGHFPTDEQAALAYNVAAQELFGEFAFLNEVQDHA